MANEKVAGAEPVASTEPAAGAEPAAPEEVSGVAEPQTKTVTTEELKGMYEELREAYNKLAEYTKQLQQAHESLAERAKKQDASNMFTHMDFLFRVLDKKDDRGDYLFGNEFITKVIKELMLMLLPEKPAAMKPEPANEPRPAEELRGDNE
jgi:molecular chaperone GrpE (heat shock protein)